MFQGKPLEEIYAELSEKEAFYFLAYFMAQDDSESQPHVELGYDTATKAFEAIGRKFGRPANSVRAHRDRFDRFTDSSRVGWD